jgi:predicted nucleic acid-binding protein
MVIVIDTNIILDALLKREPFDVYAYEILKSCDKGQIKAYIASFAVTDIYYFITRLKSHDDTIKALKSLFNLVDVVSVTKTDIKKAMMLNDFKDLEDALQFQSAKKVKADFIVTRDKEFQKICGKAIAPEMLLKALKNG